MNDQNWTSAQIEKAKKIWAEREKQFPAFTRMTWEQGTELAKTTLLQRLSDTAPKAP